MRTPAGPVAGSGSAGVIAYGHRAPGHVRELLGNHNAASGFGKSTLAKDIADVTGLAAGAALAHREPFLPADGGCSSCCYRKRAVGDQPRPSAFVIGLAPGLVLC